MRRFNGFALKQVDCLKGWLGIENDPKMKQIDSLIDISN